MHPVWLALSLLVANIALAQAPVPEHHAADLGKAIINAGFDAQECYRIRDLQIAEEDANFFLTDGYLIFGKPVNGEPVMAVFTADVEGGDAELLLLPPDPSERKSLAVHIGSPNLNEHFRVAMFYFTDGTAKALREQLAQKESKKVPDIGALLAEKWAPVAKNVSSSFESRLVLDLLTPAAEGTGFFCALISGDKLGNFDVIRDGRVYEQMMAGQVSDKEGNMNWTTWTSFVSRSVRNKGGKSGNPFQPEIKISDYKIDGVIGDQLRMSASVQMQLTTSSGAPLKGIPFDLNGRMQAIDAKIDGEPVEVYQRDSIRNGMIQNSGNELLLLIPARPLAPGSAHTVEIRVEGNVIQIAGKNLYYIGARGGWYPGRGLQFSNYDVTFRYPAHLQLVTAGEIKDDRLEGGTRITRRVATGKVRLLGLNLGEYDRKQLTRDGITVEAFANKAVEEALRSRPVVVQAEQPGVRPRRGAFGAPMDAAVVVPPTPSPSEALERMASDIGSAAAWFEARFGKPPLHHLAVSPLPGRFGQGFPGMIYLSTLSYFQANSRQIAELPKSVQFFFTDLMRVHEVAHQWWGNTVVAATYHHEWIQEALANYSALLYEESTQGHKALDSMLDQYRKDLLAKMPDGTTMESAGPVVQGRRLETSDNISAWPAVIYGKGTWILHMLRRQMGDDRFQKMLAELRQKYEWNTLDTEQFRALAAGYLPSGSKDPKLESFFDQWIYSTGIPALKLSYSVKGKPGAYKLTGTVAQSQVPEDFSVIVPVEIQTARGRTTIQVRTGSDPAPFSASVPSLTTKAVLDPQNAILKR